MASKISIGLVGCGFGSVTLLRELLYLDTEVIVVDPEEDHRLEAIKLGAAEAVATLSELPTVQGIIVTALADDHHETVVDTVARNVPVLAETPFSANTQEAERLAKLAPERLFIMHPMRYHVGIEMLSRIASEKELGAIEWLRITRTAWLDELPTRDAAWSLLSQDLTIVLQLLGKIPPPRIAVSELVGENVAGVLAVLGESPRVVIEDSTRYSDNRREVRLHCAEGVAVLPDTACGYIEVTRNEETGVPEPERRQFSQEAPLLRELKTFLAHIRNKKRATPRSSAEDGFAVAQATSKLKNLAGA